MIRLAALAAFLFTLQGTVAAQRASLEPLGGVSFADYEAAAAEREARRSSYTNDRSLVSEEPSRPLASRFSDVFDVRSIQQQAQSGLIDWSYRRDIDTLSILTTAATLAVIIPTIATDDEDKIEDLGDWTQILTPAAGGIASLFEETWEGSEQFAWHFIGAVGSARVGKILVDRWRPNAADEDSFPSGHTTASFQGASYIGTRYGARFGLPAYIAASYTGFSRIYAQKHFTDDVTAGISIALLWGWAVVTPYEPGKPEKATIRPTAFMTGDSMGVGFEIPFVAPSFDHEPQADAGDFEAKWRFEFEFGTAWTAKNAIASPAGSGTSLPFHDFDSQTNPDIYSIASLEYFVDNWTILGRFAPYEVRDVGRSSTPISFAGQSFPANTDVRTEYQFFDTRVRASYGLELPKPIFASVGAGVSWLFTYAALEVPGQRADIDDNSFLPLLYAKLGVNITDEIKWFVEADGMQLSNDEYYDINTKVIWQSSPQWDWGIGFRANDRSFETSTMKNDLQQNKLTLSVAHRF